MMLFPLILSLLELSHALAIPLTQRIVDNTEPSGPNPIKISGAEWLGVQTSANSCSRRDLGFTGKLGGDWYAVYGDTSWCASGVADVTKDNGAFNGMVRDSVSRMTMDVLKTEDLNLNGDSPIRHTQQFIPFNTSWGEDQSYGFGGTSLCATNNSTLEGAVFYVVNANAAGLKGAGIAKVNVVNDNVQVTQRYGDNGYWWPASTSARFGDIAAYRDEKSDYIYALGGPPSNETGFVNGQYIYQARVKAADAFDLSKYEYWHGRNIGWNTEPLTEFTPETAVMWDAGQGQLTWNDYYQSYIFVHTVPTSTQVALRTAPSPEGPWSEDTIVYNAQIPSGNMMYAGVAHPYLDPSGKTLTISYSNYPTDLEAIKVTFQ